MSNYRSLAQATQARLDRAAAVDVPRDRRSDVARPPGPSAVSALPRLLNRGPATAQFFIDIEREHPSVAHLTLLGQHLYVLNDPDAIVDVFLTRGRRTMKGRGLEAAKALLGNGLLTSEGEVHLKQRRLVQPAFHRDRIASYAGDMVSRAAAHGDAWRDGCVRDAREIDIVRDMSSLTLAIVGDTLFDADLTGEAREVGEALSEVLEGAGGRILLGPAALRVPTPGRRRALEASARLDAVVARLITEHRNSDDRGDILSMLVAAHDDGEAMSDEQVRDEVMTLMLAGHETTAMALSWTWLLLAAHPDVVAWWHGELDDVLADRDPSIDDYERLVRTRAIVAESMRLFPPAWIMGRRLLDDMEVGGYLLPRGTIAVASTLALQRSERWWTNPQQFTPSRWLTESGEFDESVPGQPKGAWFPFGFGNRRCIGEQFAWTEGVLVLATLGRRFTLARTSTSPVLLTPNVTLRPSGPTGMTVCMRGH